MVSMHSTTRKPHAIVENLHTGKRNAQATVTQKVSIGCVRGSHIS